MLYSLGKSLFKLALNQFFSEIRHKGYAPLENGPLLVVPNHANYLIDSLVIAAIFKRDFYFMARSTLFSGELLSALLRLCHLVPIYRRQDNVDTTKNLEAIKFAVETLKEHKAIALFPEGVSMGERKLYPLKTGAARIALQAEEQAQWQLDLKIQPVGLTYSDIDQFRSSITVYFDQPISVREWRERYEKDSTETVRQLTEQLTQRLKEITVEVQDQRNAELLEKIAKLYRSLDSGVDDHQRMKLVAKNLEVVAPKQPEKAAELEGRINEYLGMLRTMGLTETASLQSNASKIWLFFAFPLALFGFSMHYLPYSLVGPWAKRLSPHAVSLGSMKLIVGLVLFIGWYCLWLLLMLALRFSIFSALLFVAVVIFSGSFLNRHADTIRLQVISGLWPGEHNPLNVLRVLRAELIEELEELRVE